MFGDIYEKSTSIAICFSKVVELPWKDCYVIQRIFENFT